MCKARTIVQQHGDSCITERDATITNGSGIRTSEIHILYEVTLATYVLRAKASAETVVSRSAIESTHKALTRHKD